MAFKDFSAKEKGVELLQRSLEKGRLGHAYLFSGHRLEHLEAVARSLAKTLNCEKPLLKEGKRVDCCNACPTCVKIEGLNHPDVHWARPESKSRLITIDQMRDVMQQINLKAHQADHKFAVIVGADRLNTGAANAFLKTLEEPPPRSVLVLLTTEPQRILETILSRCLRLTFRGEGEIGLGATEKEWLDNFVKLAAREQKSLISRYQLMEGLTKRLSEIKKGIDERLTANSPLEVHKDAEKDLQEKWEEELKASIEAEYRRQRSDLLGILQRWLRDVWLGTLGREEKKVGELMTFPEIEGTARVAQRISSAEAAQNLSAMEELQRWLHSNVQESLALEVGLLKLKL